MYFSLKIAFRLAFAILMQYLLFCSSSLLICFTMKQDINNDLNIMLSFLACLVVSTKVPYFISVTVRHFQLCIAKERRDFDFDIEVQPSEGFVG